MEKIGSFWETTNVLNISIMGIPVRIIRRAMIRLEGFTEGPPISTGLSFKEGPLSRGSPEPLKIRPIRFSEKHTSISRPRKRILSPVETPRPPAKTCNETKSPSMRFTSAKEVPKAVSISASSLYLIPSARTVITLPLIDSILL